MVNKSLRYVVVESSLCAACGSCEDICPRGAIKVYSGCYARVDVARCVGCGLCAQTCPASLIHLEVRS